MPATILRLTSCSCHGQRSHAWPGERRIGEAAAAASARLGKVVGFLGRTGLAAGAEDTPIRILLWHWGRRGAGPRITYELADALRSRPGIEIHMSLSRQSELFSDSAALALPGVHVDSYTGLVSAAFGTLRLPVLCRRLATYTRAAGIDVVLCTMHHPWNVPAIFLLRRLGVPFVSMVHNATRHPGEGSRLLPWLVAMEARRADCVLALSRHVANQLRDLRRISADRIAVVSHGAFRFSGPEAPPRRFPQGRPFRLLFFGRILEYKGLPLLIDAYERLGGSRSVELHVVGSGNAGTAGARLRGLAGACFDNRWVPEAEVGRVLAGADLLVLPYVEASQSGVAAAAFGAGIPVVATPVGGLAEQVRHGEYGLVARDVSAGGLSEAIASLMEDPPLYERCAENAWKAARSELAWPAVAAEIEKILRRAASRRSVPAMVSHGVAVS